MNPDQTYAPILETDRLLLRKLTIDDVEAVYSYGADEKVSEYCLWDTHETLQDSKAFVEFALNGYKEGHPALWGIVLKETNTLIGTIDFVAWQPAHYTAEIGYVLARDFWGQGLMTEAAQSVIRFGFEQMNLVRIQAKCFTENVGSTKVMQKTGMTYEGTHRQAAFVKGRHWDLHYYAILRRDFTQK